ncbi:MAG: FlgD immunoglobulin-like domain containing protein [Candidatus Cloacimonetes bacterium]|nr:FlgD immunoglobulin-like domain containing protein [Candidatus Cloacimonadota bacterium]
MKYVKVALIALVMLLLCTGGNAISFYLMMNEVTNNSVYGDLHISNLTEEPVVLNFPTTGHFDLMVDGQEGSVAYLDIPTELTIPAQNTLSLEVSYIGSSDFTYGSHIVQARYVQAGNPPAGYPRTFYVGEPNSDIYALDYTLSIQSVGETSITASLSMYNSLEQYWMYGFPYATLATLWVDGVYGSGIYAPMSLTIYIDPGETLEETLYHQQSQPYTPGWHTAVARLLLNDNPAVASTSFYVESTALDTETQPGGPSLQISASPNPFNPSTTLSFSLPEDGFTRIDIYNLKGQKVKTLTSTQLRQGRHQLAFSGTDARGAALASGIYIATINQNGRLQSTKLALMK